MISAGGTYRGKLRSVGRRTVKVGMDRSRFDGWGWKSVDTPFVFCMIKKDVRKRIHSTVMLVRLVISISIAHRLMLIRGQRSCAPPVMQSPMRMCWVRAMK